MKKNIFNKWTDTQFKTIFAIILIIALIPTILLYGQTRPMEDKYKALMETKQVYILDPSGQKYLVSALDSQEKTFEIFGKILLKKMLTFDFKGSPENMKFVRQYTSPEVSKRLFLDTEKLRQEVVDTSGIYQVQIKKYKLSRKGDEYIMDIWFDHVLVSKSMSASKNYLVSLKMVNSSPNHENYTGIFLTDYGIHNESSSEYKEAVKVFGKLMEKR
jgi:hypothetical protein